MVEFKDIFKSLRNERNISLSTLEKRLGISRTTLCKWDSGKGSPTLFNACCVADFFGVSLDYLAGRSDKNERN